MRKVEVTEYNPSWKQQFEQEAIQIKKIFTNEIIDLHHIGSTSIPHLKAKPIIDILMVVKNIDLINPFYSQMSHLGYKAKGENGISGRRYFEKGEIVHLAHVHVFQEGNEHIHRHLAFRDFLRSHPQVANDYGELKEILAQKYPYDITSYIAGKRKLVEDIEQQALAWIATSQS
ncbi:GrpB family protein [Hazenella coriacea]|uniref:GrpB-like predicted nucleotidyltransferase (UPF0157 family) n=1 Tax=Hazenella coriacea TaxID=1179467 RepID=A0A4R3L2L2_9BACL|nr:GrpB family protein [Hazenella coriacea]TCS93135.1 GrpB-like predicted nucleotidyltransferase (UPF0157 family) [Hazenella coriacea]